MSASKNLDSHNHRFSELPDPRVVVGVFGKVTQCYKLVTHIMILQIAFVIESCPTSARARQARNSFGTAVDSQAVHSPSSLSSFGV